MKRIITKMYLCLLAFCITGGISAQTQNSMTTLYFLKLSKSYTSIQKREELLVLTKILYLNRYLLERYMKWEQ